MAELYYPPQVNGIQKTLDAQLDTGVTASLTLNNTTNIQNKRGVIVINRIDASGTEKDAADREFIGYTGVSGSTLTGLTRNIDNGSSDQDHASGSVVEFIPDVVWAQAINDVITTEHGTDGTHGAVTATSVTTDTVAAETTNGDLSASGNGTGAVDLNKLKIASGSVVADAILDEDTLSSDSATALATQQSIKAYVDALTTGKVLQVVSGTTTTQTDSSSTTWIDTNLTVTITPASTSNKVLIYASHGESYVPANSEYLGIRLVRGATPDVLSTFSGNLGSSAGGAMNIVGGSVAYLDSPSTTSATTYKTQFRRVSGSGTVQVQKNSSMSTIVAIEIAA